MNLRLITSLLLGLGSPLGLGDTLTLPGQLAGKGVVLSPREPE